MADSYYQIATIPKLYVSYPLYQYANNTLDEYSSDNGIVSEEDMIKLLQIDPSNQVHLQSESWWEFLRYKIVPSYDNETPVVTSGLWNFDFLMLLGHNFDSTNHRMGMGFSDGENYQEATHSNIVNAADFNPEYDGWSLYSIDDVPSDEYREIVIAVINENVENIDCKIGSVLWGKSYEFPINTALSTTTKFEYGIKQKSTISGKTISTANWTKPNNWITEPFGLGNQEGDNFQRRSGRRVWKMQFDSLAPDKVMNQNMMMNDNNYTRQDNHSEGATANSSLYNINDSTDFYTNVINRSMSSRLPMVLQVDKNNNSADQFAIVRLNPNYTIKQKSPNLYSISVTLTEQI